MFFPGKLIFEAEGKSFISRFLHNHTALELQKFLQVHGLSLVILPVRLNKVRNRPLFRPAEWRIPGDEDSLAERGGFEPSRPLISQMLSHSSACPCRMLSTHSSSGGSWNSPTTK